MSLSNQVFTAYINYLNLYASFLLLMKPSDSSLGMLKVSLGMPSSSSSISYIFKEMKVSYSQGPCHCVVPLSKIINPSLGLVQPRKTRHYINERLLMGCKESNQTNIARGCPTSPTWPRSYKTFFHAQLNCIQNSNCSYKLKY